MSEISINNLGPLWLRQQENDGLMITVILRFWVCAMIFGHYHDFMSWPCIIIGRNNMEI